MTNGSGPTPPTAPRPHILSGAAEQSARIVRLPDALSAVARAQRVEGEVVQQNADGSTRVRTNQGDIDILVRGRQPQSGQTLQVDIPAGRPPRQVLIRQAAPQQTPPPQTQTADEPAVPTRLDAQIARAQQIVQRAVDEQAPIRTQTTGPNPSSSAPRPTTATPQPLPAQTSSASAPRPAPLEPGTSVRLLPVTPAQAQQIVQATTLSLTQLPTQVTQVAYTANLIAQNATNANTQALLQVKAPDIVSLSTLMRGAPLPTSSTAAPVGSAIASPPPITQIAQQFFAFPAAPASQPGAALQGTTTQGPVGTAIALTQSPFNAASSNPLATLITTLPGIDSLNALSSSLARITQFDGKLLNIQPPQISLSAPTPDGKSQGLPIPSTITANPTLAAPPQAQAGSLMAQVTGITPNNLPMVTLQWPGSALPQSFILQFNAANLPLGSQITLQPQNIMIAQPGSAAALAAAAQGQAGAPPLPQNLLSLFGPGPWPVMDEAYQTLLQASPQAAAALGRILPSPANPAQLGSTALLFIAAVRSGDIGSWLGDKKVDILQRVGRSNILGRLTQDLSTLAQRTADTASNTGDWRAVPLPMFWEGEIQKISLFVKNQGGGKSDDETKEGQTRFIFDLDLNRMGGVQLDGLVRGKRFDLVLRTQTPLSTSMQQAMRHSYSHALQNTELHGDLSFQGDIKSWVNVLQQDAHFGASA